MHFERYQSLFLESKTSQDFISFYEYQEARVKRSMSHLPPERVEMECSRLNSETIYHMGKAPYFKFYPCLEKMLQKNAGKLLDGSRSGDLVLPDQLPVIPELKGHKGIETKVMSVRFSESSGLGIGSYLWMSSKIVDPEAFQKAYPSERKSIGHWSIYIPGAEMTVIDAAWGVIEDAKILDENELGKKLSYNQGRKLEERERLALASAALIAGLQHDPRFMEREVISKNRVKYDEAKAIGDAEQAEKIVQRSRKRGVNGFSLGRQLQEEQEKNLRSGGAPTIVAPYLAHRTMYVETDNGKELKRVLRPISGHVKRPRELTRAPHGYAPLSEQVD